MTSAEVFTNLFDDDEVDDVEEDDAEDTYAEGKTREVAVAGLYSVEQLFNMMAENKTGSIEGGRESDDSVVFKEVNTTDSNSNETNLNMMLNKKVKVKPSRSLKRKNAQSAAPLDLIRNPLGRHKAIDSPEILRINEPEWIYADNIPKVHSHSQGTVEAPVDMGSDS